MMSLRVRSILLCSGDGVVVWVCGCPVVCGWGVTHAQEGGERGGSPMIKNNNLCVCVCMCVFVIEN